MGKKYIIEMEDKPFHKEDGDFLYRVKGFNTLVFDMTGISKLAPYHEPDLGLLAKENFERGYRQRKAEDEKNIEQVKKEAYDEGYDDAKGGYENGFENGMIVAWDAARKIANMPYGEEEKAFGSGGWAFVEKHTASEAIEKIRQYEQEQEEFHVGDEVIRHYKNEFMEGDDAPSIFLSEEDGHFRCLAFNGRSIMIAEYPKNQYRKTGRHFPEIAAVLEKMRGEQDG